MLSEYIKNFLKNQKLGYVATVSKDNKPNVSPKGTLIVWDSIHLAFADIRSPDTMKNLMENPAIEISVIDPILRKGYLFSGSTKIISSGLLYDDILYHYRNSGVKSPIGAIVLVKVDHVEEVSSPLYDLGLTEEQMKSRWKKHYLGL